MHGCDRARQISGRWDAFSPQAMSRVASSTYQRRRQAHDCVEQLASRIFDLEDVFSGVKRAVARVWSKHHSIGVRFLTKRS